MENELLSNCCGAPMLGEPFNNPDGSDEAQGFCADCKEPAVFVEAE